MKKALVILLALAMVLSLTACGSSSEETTAAKEETTAEAAETTEAKEETTAAPETEAPETEAPETEEPSTEEASTEAEEDGQNPVMNFIGVYAYERASIEVECEGTENAKFTVMWGSSAAEHREWTMSGKFDEATQTVEYDNCACKDVVFNEDGTVESETPVYENGTGSITFGEDMTLTWKDDQDHAADDMVFEYASFVPEESEGEAEEDGQNPVMNFIGVYAYERASIKVECEGTENALFTVMWSSSAAEHREWTMSGKLDVAAQTVDYDNCFCKDVVFTEDGTVESETTVYENGTGTFTFGEGNTLTWVDDQDNAAEGIVFEYMTPAANVAEAFLGMWSCGRATIDISFEEETDIYRVQISWSSSAAEKTAWQYVCAYDGEKLISDENGLKSNLIWDENGDMTTEEVYNDGTATFEIDAEGNLLWNDAKENAGEDMLFMFDGPIETIEESVEE